MSVDTKEKTKVDFSTLVDLIKFDNFYGRGGSFLITPLNEAKVFSKEKTDPAKSMRRFISPSKYSWTTTSSNTIAVSVKDKSIEQAACELFNLLFIHTPTR